jgi:hypothetical protein
MKAKSLLGGREGTHQCNALETIVAEHTNRHALLGTQYLRAKTSGLYQGLHFVTDDVVYRPTVFPLQIFLAMHDVYAQAGERLGGGIRGLVPTASLPLGEQRAGRAGVVVVIGRSGGGGRCCRRCCCCRSGAGAGAGAAALRGTRGDDLGREGGELVDEVLRAEVSVELLVWPAGWPGALDEDGREHGGYLGRCDAPDGERARRCRCRCGVVGVVVVVSWRRGCPGRRRRRRETRARRGRAG